MLDNALITLAFFALTAAFCMFFVLIESVIRK